MTSPVINKVAQVTFLFWVVKIIATTLGETAGDLLSMTMGLGYVWSSVLLFGLLLVALTAQLRSQHFHPALYWTVILATSTVGTTLSDMLDRTLGLGYLKGSILLGSGLALVLVIWRLSEKTLSVSRVVTRRAEFFYWFAILFSNSLGTALGDFLADDSGLGFGGGAAVIGLSLGIILIARYTTRLNQVGLFWAAFILTRPLGATLGDLLTKPVSRGGLDFGTIGSSLVLMAALIFFIWLSTSLAKRKAKCC